MKKERNMLVRRLCVALAIVVFLVALVAPGWIRLSIKRDREEAIPKKGVATVVMLVPERMEQVTNRMYPAQVLVRFNGAVYPVRSVPDIEGMAVNKPVKILYRIGKSGHVYVEYAQRADAPDDSLDSANSQ